MKRYVSKLLAIISILLVVLVPLSSCKGKEDDGNNFDDLYAAISEYQEMVSSQKETSGEETSVKVVEEKRFVVIIPAGCGAEIFDSAVLLSETMSKYVAGEVEVAYDCDRKSTNDYTEILIGETDRYESIKYLKQIRADDYGYKYTNGSVVIGAHDDSLCAKTVELFSENIENNSISLREIEDIDTYTFSGSYDIDKIKINGFELCEYDIVYPSSNKLSEKKLAEMLQDRLAKYSGYCLRVISDKECTDATRAICVGESSLTIDYDKTDCAYLSVNSAGHIELVATENVGIYHATLEFFDIITESEKEKLCNVELSGTRQYIYNREGISFYIVREDFTSGSLDKYVTAIRGARSASLAVFDRLSDSVVSNLNSNLENLVSAENQLYCYEDMSEFSCVLSESKSFEGGDILTLVMKRSDGRRFCFVGAFSANSSKGTDDALFEKFIAECEKYEDMPLIVAHEFSEKLDRSFADGNPQFSPIAGTSGIYYSSEYLKLQNHTTEEIGYPIFADVLDFEFYYG